MIRTVLFASASVAMAIVLMSQSAPPREQVGPLPDGGFLLNSGWKIKPAGRQVPLGTFPMSTAVSKDGRYLLVLNGGYLPPSISVLRADSMEELDRVPVDDGWLGLTFSPDGSKVYVGGGSRASVYEFGFNDGKLTSSRTLVIVGEKERKPEDFVGDVQVSPDGRVLYATVLHRDAVQLINLQTGALMTRAATGRRPYRILMDPNGRSFYVSNWADGSVTQHKVDTGERVGVPLRLGAHPTDLIWRERKQQETGEEQTRFASRIFVSAANTNSVYVVGVTEGRELRTLETINVSMTPQQPLGMTPSALGMSEDGSRLFVVCSDANAVAIADISEERSSVLGFIPTGWYPTAVRSLPTGRLVILNGRGVRSFPNPQGPNPTQRTSPLHGGVRAVQYVGRLQTGTASVIEPFTREQLDTWSDEVLANSAYKDARLSDAGIPAENPVPTRPGGPSPLRHVIYIVKENRTYDQVLGDLGKGNGDPSLVLFDKRSTPNHRKLANAFVLLDNFYVNADVSADGHNWSTSAIANDYVQKMWPNSYGGRRKRYDYEGGEVAALPPAGYLWTNAAAAGITMRNYGWWSSNITPAPAAGQTQIAMVRDPVLAKVTNPRFRAFDMDYPDVERAKIFIEDLAEWQKTGNMPQLITLRIGNDHTWGAAAGKLHPMSSMADNDLALGMIVEAVSRSRFWGQTAIFVLEDDAQNGPDHVDSHRSPAFVISPYTRRGAIDSTMYNTVSMLRTMELILGLRPMTHFDAGARPMWAAFSNKPDLTPYEKSQPEFPMDQRNPANTALAARTARMSFEEADEIDDDEMNDILWRVLRQTEPPTPTRSYFSR